MFDSRRSFGTDMRRNWFSRLRYYVTSTLRKPHNADILSHIARNLEAAGAISRLRKARSLADEPRVFSWITEFSPGKYAGGASVRSDTDALAATLGEGLERAIWFGTTSHLNNPALSRLGDMTDNFLDPTRCVSIAETVRKEATLAPLDADSLFTWVDGYSWITRRTIRVPMQLVSRYHADKAATRAEPFIRPPISTGLATGASRYEALCHGALEIIERDAYMIMWLNQLSLPRINVSQLVARNAALKNTLAECTDFGLSVDFIRLITDAPASVVCAVVCDTKNGMPRYTLGLAARATVYDATEKALVEALQARVTTRLRLGVYGPYLGLRPKRHERLLFWSTIERSQRLSFLTSGPVEDVVDDVWVLDTPKQHFGRIVAWCREREYELTTVCLTESSLNASPWYVEFILIPELHPMHLDEHLPCLESARRREIPTRFGYTTRPEPATDPHPFI